MATGYSGWVGGDDWRTICEANVTSTGGTACTVAVSCKVESRYAYTNYCNANVSCNGQTSGTNTTGRVSTNSTTTVQTASFSVARGQSAKSVSCSAKAWMPTTGIAAYVTGASASTSVSIPALEHHTVSYDANGGEGAPAAQTKWYGSILTLSSTVPTRANYEFLGWATSVGGAVAYQPGSKYGLDQDATLYAVWNLLHTPPAVSVSVSRVSASGSTAEDAHGSWAHVSVAWETEDPATEVSASLDTGELELSGTTTGTSGACEAWAEVDQSSHIATATVSDGTMTTTATDALAQVTPVLEANGVSGLGLLTRAPETGVDVGSSMRVQGGITDFDGVPYERRGYFHYSSVKSGWTTSGSIRWTVVVSRDELVAHIGRDLDFSKDIVICKNGDPAAQPNQVVYEWRIANGDLVAYMGGSGISRIDVNIWYLIEG